VFLTACQAIGADPIEDELSRAKEAYRAALDKARAALLEAIDQRIKDAALAGSLADVKSLQSQRDAFETGGTLPRHPRLVKASHDCQDAGKKARVAMTAAYDKAVKDYTKALDIANAEAVKAEPRNSRPNRRSTGPATPLMPPTPLRPRPPPGGTTAPFGWPRAG
jgi:hypothetical protein